MMMKNKENIISKEFRDVFFLKNRQNQSMYLNSEEKPKRKLMRLVYTNQVQNKEAIQKKMKNFKHIFTEKKFNFKNENISFDFPQDQPLSPQYDTSQDKISFQEVSRFTVVEAVNDERLFSFSNFNQKAHLYRQLAKIAAKRNTTRPSARPASYFKVKVTDEKFYLNKVSLKKSSVSVQKTGNFSKFKKKELKNHYKIKKKINSTSQIDLSPWNIEKSSRNYQEKPDIFKDQSRNEQ